MRLPEVGKGKGETKVGGGWSARLSWLSSPIIKIGKIGKPCALVLHCASASRISIHRSETEGGDNPIAWKKRCNVKALPQRSGGGMTGGDEGPTSGIVRSNCN